MLGLRCINRGRIGPRRTPWTLGHVYPVWAMADHDQLTGRPALRWVSIKNDEGTESFLARDEDGLYVAAIGVAVFKLVLHGGDDAPANP